MERSPYNYIEDGIPSGIFINLIQVLSEILGIKIEWVRGYSRAELIIMTQGKEIDVLPNIINIKPGENHIAFSNPIIQMNYGIVTKNTFNPNNIFIDLSSLHVGYIESYDGIMQIFNNYKDVTPIPVRSLLHGIELVEEGKIDAYVDDLSVLTHYESYYFKNRVLTRALLKSSTEHFTDELRIGVREDWTLLIEAFNAAISFIYEEEYRTILDRYIQNENINSLNYISTKLHPFTKEEVVWLSKNRIIPVYIVEDLPPISYYENGIPSGITSGYLKHLENLLGIKFEFLGSQRSLPHGLDLLLTEEVKLIPNLANTLDRRDMGIGFGSTYIELPISVYGNSRSSYIKDLSSIDRENFRVLAIKGHAIIEWLKKDYPQIKVSPVKSAEEALSLVNRNKKDLYISDIITTNRVLAKNHFNKILHLGSTKYSYKLSMAFNENDEIFKSIIEKVLPSIKKEHGSFIESFWSGKKVDANIDPILYFIIGGILLIVTIIIFFQRRIYQVRQKLLEQHAVTDPLTGLNNRRFLENIYLDEVKRSRRNNTNLIFMMFDIDNFKKYNDTYGHSMGDKALKQTADCIRSTFQRGGDHCFRLGGEEFGVLTTVKKESDSYTLAKQVCFNLTSLNIMHSKNAPYGVLTISGGVTTIRTDEFIPFDEYLKLADIQLYKAKRSGRNKIL